MKRSSQFACRARLRRCPGSYRPQLLVLEDRLLLGDALLGTLLGSSLIASSQLHQSSVIEDSAGKFEEQALSAPIFAEPGDQNPAVVRVLVSGDVIGTSRRDSTERPSDSEI